jgi:hypothetical protein
MASDTPVQPEPTPAPKDGVPQETPSFMMGEVSKPGAAEELGSIVCIIADEGVRA